MDILEISIETAKYKHDIKRAFVVITSDVEALSLLDIDFVSCSIEAMVNLEMVDGSSVKVVGRLDQEGNLVGIIGECWDAYPIYNNTFTDSALCEIQDKINLRKY